MRFGFKALSGRLVRVDVQHEIYGLDGKFGLSAQLKIDQFTAMQSGLSERVGVKIFLLQHV